MLCGFCYRSVAALSVHGCCGVVKARAGWSKPIYPQRTTVTRPVAWRLPDKLDPAAQTSVRNMPPVRQPPLPICTAIEDQAPRTAQEPGTSRILDGRLAYLDNPQVYLVLFLSLKKGV